MTTGSRTPSPISRCRAFREQVGLPPHAYVTHRRVTLAQSPLARGLPQAEVAASVGFYDQSLLHRHFKRIVGLTPGAFVGHGLGSPSASSRSPEGRPRSPRRPT
ncbi:MAG: helix-turn-helix domain-containing protein [Polyangiaceae bacterium]|nr:helix-turn-helix domain-containing protein [Polyangiaceae bacterium]